jgi:DNA-binding response OmpR family regulator
MMTAQHPGTSMTDVAPAIDEQFDPPQRSDHLVALIDDDDRVLALARLALSKHGVGVISAGTATGGLDLVLRDEPDLVVLDIVMPDMSGWEVLRRIRAASDVPVLLLSGRDSDIDKARGLDLGADDYLTKPFSFLEFEARVRALLRRPRACLPPLFDGA